MQLFKLVSQGGYTEKPNTRGIDKDSKKTSAKNSLESPTEFGYKCVCLNARSIVNKRNELNIMVEDIDPHIIGITESWATPDISDAELRMTGYVMFRKDRLGRRGGGVILYIKESIQAYEIKLEKEAECEEAVWCNIVTGKSTLTVGLVYRSPNQGSYTQLAIKFKGFQGFFKGFQVAIFKGNPVYNSLAFFTEPVKQRVNHSIQGCLHVTDHE